jgi:NACalpha-BTF3-like transcription factor
VRTESSLNESDVELVMEKAGVSREKAAAALEKSGGDIAAAIMELGEKEGE